MDSLALRQAWLALPDVPCIPDFGVDSILMVKKVQISQYGAWSQLLIHEALVGLIPSKHCVVLAPSVGGVPVPITQMSMDSLYVAATSQPKMETSAVIDSEFRLAFDNVMVRGRDPDSAVSMDAMEMLQDLTFDHFLLKIASNTVKWFVFFPDTSIQANMFLAGNRKIVSFDKTRIAAVEKSLKRLNLPSISAAVKEKAPLRKRKPKKQDSSSSDSPPSRRNKKQVVLSSSDSSSSDSEDSGKFSDHGEGTDSEEDAQLKEGTVTPIVINSGNTVPANTLLGSYAALPAVNSFSQAQAHAQAQAEAQLALVQAQERVAALAAAGLVYQMAPANQTNGAPFKAPPLPVVPIVPVANSLPFSYSIPKRDKHEEKKLKKSAKHGKSKKAKGKKSSRKSKKHASRKSRKESSSESENSSSEQSGEEAAKQVIICKNMLLSPPCFMLARQLGGPMVKGHKLNFLYIQGLKSCL